MLGLTHLTGFGVETVSPAVAATAWNPSDKGSNVTISNGNLTMSSPNSSQSLVRASKGASVGKYYWEIVCDSGSTSSKMIGVATAAAALADFLGANSYGYAYYDTGTKYYNGSSTAYGPSYATGDVVGVALNMDSGKLWFAKNGEWLSSGNPTADTGWAFSGLSGTFFPAASSGSGALQLTARFSATAWTYAPPSGFTEI